MTTPPLALSAPDGRGRLYRFPADGRLVPSVTTVIGERDKPALRNWACRQVAATAVAHRTALDGLVDRLGEQGVVDRLATVPERIAGRAAAIGDSVHQWLEAAAKGEPLPEVPEDARPWLAGAARFLEECAPRWVLVEATMFNLSLGYAGTCDFVADIGGTVCVGDYKSGRAVHPGSVAMQLAALARAEVVVEPDGTTTPVPPVQEGVVVHIRPDGTYLARRVDIGEQPWRAFRALLYVRTTLQDEERLLGEPLLPATPSLLTSSQ
jgi:hypothetical protein